MKVLVTGANGQVGQELVVTRPESVELTALDQDLLDITSEGQVRRVLAETRPDLVVNAAAYTAVDRAEEQRDAAFAINRDGARILAAETSALGARLIHLSTDFVFRGDQVQPYPPAAEPDPQGVYGSSKLAGEKQVVRLAGAHGLVLRTAWVYSRFGRNFVKTMLQLLAERQQLSVVSDQIGTPTWGQSLARAVWACGDRSDLHGIHHWTDAGTASWYDFAIAIQDEARDLGLLESSCQVVPVSTAEFPTPARRPPYSVLDTSGLRTELALATVHWRRQLRAMLIDMKAHGKG